MMLGGALRTFGLAPAAGACDVVPGAAGVMPGGGRPGGGNPGGAPGGRINRGGPIPAKNQKQLSTTLPLLTPTPVCNSLAHARGNKIKLFKRIKDRPTWR